MRRIETVAAVLALAGCMSATPVAAARFAYVTNAFDDTVSILDARTGVTAATVAVGCAPRGAAALPDGSRVYVANTCLEDPDIVVDTVSVIDTATRAVVATVEVGTAPTSLAVSPSGGRVYVANSGMKDFLDPPVSGSVSVIDVPTNAVVATLPLSFAPRDLVPSPDGSVLYVTGPAGVAVVDPTDGTVRRMLAASNGWLAIAPDGATLYVAEQSDDSLAVLDTTSGRTTATLSIGVAPQDVAIDPQRRRIFVTSAGANPNLPPDEVTVVDTRRDAVVRRLDGGATPTGIALAAHDLLVVANFYTGDVLFLRPRTGRLVRRGHAGSGASAVVVVPR